jgi:predicted metal-dependent peptidase
MRDHGFYASALMQREIITLPEGTAGVDEKANLYVCEAWFETLTPQERKFVLAHEAFHPLLAHHVRFGNRDRTRCNIAMDCAINQILIDDGVGRPPADCVTIDKVGAELKWPAARIEALRHASWEEIYNAMQEDAPPSKPESKPEDKPEDKPEGEQPGGKGEGSAPEPDGEQPGGKGEGSAPDDKQPEGSGDKPQDPLAGLAQGWGQVEPADVSDEEADRVIAEAAELTQRALHEATMAGTASDSLRKAVSNLSTSRVDWRAVLRNTLSKGANIREYTYARLPRRLSTWRMPAPVRDGVGKLIVLIDKSGSISEAVTHAYVAELNAIIGETFSR